MKSTHPRKMTEKGQALIIIVLALVGLMGITGMVIDGSKAFLDRRKAQNAADSAALASALARIRGGQDFKTVALQAAATNGYSNDGVANTVAVNAPPLSGPHAGDKEYVQVIIVSHVPTSFLRVVGRSEITNQVQAVARSKQPELEKLVDGTAIVSLAPESNCTTGKAFWLHGTALLEVTGGNIFVNSDNETCALVQNGNSGIRIKSNHSIRVVGGATLDKPQLLTPSVAIGAGSVAYPPFFMPTITCETPAEISPDGTTMKPGAWDEEFPPQDVTQLEPGIYCLTKGIKTNKELIGNGVLLFVQDGDVQINANANIQLSAPTSGEFAGLLLFLPLDNEDQVDIDSGAQSSFTGTILAPASHITLKGASSPYGFHGQIIGYTVEVDGSGTITITYNAAENYKAPTMPEVQLSQ